ncbi:MAG: hypothetical protein JNL32_13605 [Candidatus Kapabacteria bacterium]|nr:hypothetical protein [Candidatus Kapabacteria bacterium]
MVHNTSPGSQIAVHGTPSVSEQAAALNREAGKNTITIQTPDKILHYDLVGPPHRGVSTPHVQRSLPNVNPNTGELFMNKDGKWVRPMEQQDIRVVRNYLKRKK